MDDNVVPRTRNLRPRKPYVDPFAQPRRSVRRARARLSAADFYVLDNDEDGDWNGAADDEAADDDVIELGTPQRRSHRSHRRASSRREASRSARSTPEPTSKKRTRKPKVLLPEDVPFREPVQPQPEADPEDAAHAPSVAFIAIFIATFPSLFEDFGRLPSPQDLEAGLLAPEPSELVESVFRRILGCVLNRKKEIEVGRYGSALSELHAQRNALGMGPYFPPLQWKSKGNAFAELPWYDRLELLHVLVHWSLSASDRVRQLLRQLDDEAVNPWIGADDKGNHYYIVGFDPVAEGAEEHTQFRVYKESNRLLQTVKWEPVASNAAEVQAFLDSHVKRPAKEIGTADDGSRKDAKTDVEAEDTKGQTASTENATTNTEVINTGVPNSEQTPKEEQGEEAVSADTSAAAVEQEPESDPAPVEYDLPQTVVDTLLYFLPAMQRSEAVTVERLQKEAKRARRRNDIMWQAETISNGGGRYAGRTRGRKINYAELLRDTIDDDEEEAPRKRRLRQRDSNYEWKEPEPETRQQRHARIMAERAAERANWSSNDVSVEPTPDYVPSTLSNHMEISPATAVPEGQASEPTGFQEERGNIASQPTLEQPGREAADTQAEAGSGADDQQPGSQAGGAVTPLTSGSTDFAAPTYQLSGIHAAVHESPSLSTASLGHSAVQDETALRAEAGASNAPGIQRATEEVSTSAPEPIGVEPLAAVSSAVEPPSLQTMQQQTQDLQSSSAQGTPATSTAAGEGVNAGPASVISGPVPVSKSTYATAGGQTPGAQTLGAQTPGAQTLGAASAVSAASQDPAVQRADLLNGQPEPAQDSTLEPSGAQSSVQGATQNSSHFNGW